MWSERGDLYQTLKKYLSHRRVPNCSSIDIASRHIGTTITENIEDVREHGPPNQRHREVQQEAQAR